MDKFKILITDHIAKEGISILKEDASVEVTTKAGISDADLKEIIGNYDAIITRSGTTITADIIENPGKLKVIGRAG